MTPMARSIDFASATADAPARLLIVAELGVNHDGSPATARRLVAAAAGAGADAVKLQWFRPERLLSNQAGLAAYQRSAADSARDLLGPLVLDAEAMAAVRDAAHEAGLALIVTPFSVEDVTELAALGVDAVKIASPDAVNTPLLAAAATLSVPMLVSTGTCRLAELAPAADVLTRHGPGGCLLQCVSSYPTPDADAALGGIAAIEQRFALPVGYSDHTTSEHTGGLAVAAGACVLEKHLTHDRAASGPDHAASLEPAGLARYVAHARAAAAMLGPRAKAVRDCERDVAAVARQSVAVRRDLAAGAVLAEADLTTMRPGTGIPAAELPRLVGRRLARDVAAGDILTPKDVA